MFHLSYSEESDPRIFMRTDRISPGGLVQCVDIQKGSVSDFDPKTYVYPRKSYTYIYK